MAFAVTDLTSNLTGGGARPTQFDVQVTIPSAVPIASGAMRKLTFTCSAASLPETQIGIARVPYFGRMIPFAGDRTFAPWQTTVQNDEDFAVRDAMESWANYINARQRNVLQASSPNPALYKANGVVRQYSKVGAGAGAIRTYTFQDMWPSIVTPINLDWGATDQIETFQIVWEYTWYDLAGPTVQDPTS